MRWAVTQECPQDLLRADRLQSQVFPVMRARVRAARAPRPERGKARQGDPDLDHRDRSPSGMGYCTLCACVDEQKRKL